MIYLYSIKYQKFLTKIKLSIDLSNIKGILDCHCAHN